MPHFLARKLMNHPAFTRKVTIGTGKKTGQARIEHALAVVESLATFADTLVLRNRLPAGAADRERLGNALSLREGKTTDLDTKARRHVIRAILLAARILPPNKSNPLHKLESLEAIVKELRKKDDFALLEALYAFLPPGARDLVGDFANQSAWGTGFTHPAAHAPARFRYLVTGTKTVPHQVDSVSTADDDATRAAFEKKFRELKAKFDPDDEDADIDEPEDYDEDYDETRIVFKRRKPAGPPWIDGIYVRYYLNAFKDPSFVKAFFHSASVIEPGHVATYFPFGFILDAPAPTIISASPKDQGYANWKDDQLAELQRMLRENVSYTLLTPDEVLAATTGADGGHGYNEVIVMGTHAGAQVKASGIFVKVDPHGNIYRSGLQSGDLTQPIANLIQQASVTHGLPIIAIVDSSSKADPNPIRADSWFPGILGLP